MQLLDVCSIALCAALGSAAKAPAAASATPFADTQGRFTIGLPPGWAFAPQPGDTHGVFFRKVLEGLPANATVRMIQFNTPIDLGAFAARIAAASDQEPGFHLLFSEPTQVANIPALKRRFVVFVNGDARLPKLVEQRIFVVDHYRGYVVHAETLAEVFGSFEQDFATLFRTFVPRDGSTPVAEALPVRRTRRLDPRKLVGLWQGGGHTLQLSPAGTIVLDGLSGTYRLDQGLLDCTFGADKRLYEVSLNGDMITLAGGSFGAGQKLSRGRAEPAATRKATP